LGSGRKRIEHNPYGRPWAGAEGGELGNIDGDDGSSVGSGIEGGELKVVAGDKRPAVCATEDVAHVGHAAEHAVKEERRRLDLDSPQTALLCLNPMGQEETDEGPAATAMCSEGRGRVGQDSVREVMQVGRMSMKDPPIDTHPPHTFWAVLAM
jgi:hypothetical protein